MPELSAGDTAWVLTSAALVLLMTPGLAFFYGGMVRAKAVLNMLMMSFLCLAIVPVVWVLWGYSLAFDGSNGNLIGGLGKFGLDGVGVDSMAAAPIPEFAFVAFQAVFAIITVALISGAVAERASFRGWALFVPLWVTIVYFPVANWVWGGGWIFDLGALDFAGGTVVHINAGAAGLALALVLGKRVGWPKQPMRPHNLPFVLLGAGLLWFGWFGFNAGSALGANGLASAAFVNTMVATAAAVLGWLLVDVVKQKHSTTLGAASGAIAGLVAITPACAFVSPVGAIVIGVVAGAVCALCVGLKYRFGYDDSLDVVAVHLVGGVVGTLMIGLLASADFTGEAEGLFYGGGVDLLWRQAVAAAVVIVFSFVVAFALGKIIDRTVGFRVSEEEEVDGIDLGSHLETAYELTSTSAGLTRAQPAPAPVRTETTQGA
ncbi:ammonium transporter [Jiangella alkaliphila]|uniref:Ammonium transporter n=1 Tax=Jiangella alkaliphila TaxID=419479 RepID=A0A1H2KXE9_9ACTN|nr:ammonium transporter [Jiangella alkaliphila]SDU73038.1 ammonium transporter, Amt family [Jiangella alkaliphila]